MTPSSEREAIARIIAPQAWKWWDAGMYAPANAMYRDDSLAKADQIIARQANLYGEWRPVAEVPQDDDELERVAKAAAPFPAHPGQSFECTFTPERCLALIADNKAMREALEQAVETFRDYEQQHRAKDTVDGNMKAARNYVMASRCEAAAALHTHASDGHGEAP